MESLENIKSKNINQKSVCDQIKKATAQETWINIYPFLENLEWDTIYLLPYKITSEPFLQSLQYKILNRILNCKDRLLKWKISESNKCNYCDQIDTLEHHLIHCTTSSPIWDSLTEWICNNLLIIYHFTECEQLFGIPFTNSIDLKLINLLILFTKWFINRKKTLKAKLYFIEQICELKVKIVIIILSNTQNDKTIPEWQIQLKEVLLKISEINYKNRTNKLTKIKVCTSIFASSGSLPSGCSEWNIINNTILSYC